MLQTNCVKMRGKMSNVEIQTPQSLLTSTFKKNKYGKITEMWGNCQNIYDSQIHDNKNPMYTTVFSCMFSLFAPNRVLLKLFNLIFLTLIYNLFNNNNNDNNILTGHLFIYIYICTAPKFLLQVLRRTKTHKNSL